MTIELNATKKIMVVDDDESVRSFLTFSLKSEGFQVIPAKDAEEALRILNTETPHLILLDIMLPKMDGFTMCKKLKAEARFAKVPVLFITAYGDENSLKNTAESGAQGIIEKPIMFDELLLQVLDALAGRFSLPTRLKFSSNQ
ncbi:MAG: response regulator [Elusimicrobia bacterium]|nr:response regulator [Candidatus Obscuribacterium magneticum]